MTGTGIGYDAAGNLQYPSGRWVSYDIDGANRVKAVHNGQNGSSYYLNNVQYKPNGSLTSATVGLDPLNQWTETRGYNSRLQACTMQVQKGATTLLGLQWMHSTSDPAGVCEGTGSDNNGNVGTERLQYPSGGTPQTVVRNYSYDGATAAAVSRGCWCFWPRMSTARPFAMPTPTCAKGRNPKKSSGSFAFGKRPMGRSPAHLVFDSKLTTQANLARLDRLKIDFITLRRRSPALLCEVYGLPRSARRTIELDVPSRQYQTRGSMSSRSPCADGAFANSSSWTCGHDKPTILLTNQSASAPKLITRYARRMLIENSLSDAVRFFHMDALSSAVGLKVDFDMALLVIASGLYRLLARQMRGYAEAQARQIFRDLLDLPAQVEITEQEVRVEFHRRAHLPIVLASGLCDKPVTVPWWPKRRLRLTTYTGR